MSDFVVRVRGLPWSAKEDDVIRFFGNCTILNEKKGVHFTTGRDGRSTGEAYVELESAEDLDKAIDHHKDHMGKRYIEVFKSTQKEMQWVIGKNLPMDDCVIRLRGLPYGCTNQEILDFFDGYEIAPNGIGIITDQMRRTTGEAYVQFMSGDTAQKAREERHMERIGHRYIEIFKSSMMEAENAMNRPSMGGHMRGAGPMGMGPMGGGRGMGPGPGPRGMGMNNMGMGSGRPSPYDRPSGGGGGGFGGMGSGPMRGNVKGGNNGGGGMGFGRRNFDGGFGPVGPNISADNWQSSTGHSVHMRGLPYSAADADILDFLAPLQPVSIHIHRNANDRPTGEADVDFAIHEEAKEAMKKDREKIGTRYIELFLKSSPAGKMAGGGGGGGGGSSIGASNFQQGSNYQQGYQQGAGGHGGWGDGDYQDGMRYGMSGGMMGSGMNNMGGGGMNNMGGGGMNSMGGGGMNMAGSGMSNLGGSGMSNMGGGGMNSMGGGGMNNMGSGMNMPGGGMNMPGGGMNNMDGMMGGGNMGMSGNHMSGNMGAGPGMGHMGGMMNNQYGNMGGDMGGVGGGGYGGYNDNTNFTAF